MSILDREAIFEMWLSEFKLQLYFSFLFLETFTRSTQIFSYFGPSRVFAPNCFGFQILSSTNSCYGPRLYDQTLHIQHQTSMLYECKHSSRKVLKKKNKDFKLILDQSTKDNFTTVKLDLLFCNFQLDRITA